jgi:hypothetical protein
MITVIFSCHDLVSKSLTRSAPLLLTAILLVGCNRDEVEVYRVPKEPSEPMATGAALPPGHPETGANPSGGSASAGAPTLTYKTPAGWEEVPPGEMRAASFRVKGNDNKLADVSVLPLPGMAGGDLNNVNRWRSQVGLAAINEEERIKQAETVEMAGSKADLYEAAGEATSGEKTRILAAILRQDGVAWFFKMTGDDDLVAKNKNAFLELLKSVSFTTPKPGLPPSHPTVGGAGMAGSPAPAAAAGKSPESGKPQWQVPAGWAEAPGGQFLVAKFNIPGEGGQQAAVNVSMSAGDGGGWVGNVNRWLRQVGLGELPEADIVKQTVAIDVEGGKASIMEMSGTDPRTNQKTKVIGVMVPRPGQAWFYKLMGSDQLVDREKASFLKFVQSAQYPHAS